MSTDRIDWMEVAVVGVAGAVICALVLAFPNLVRYATVVGLDAFLLVNAFVRLKQKRLSAALALSAVALLPCLLNSPVSLALSYIAVCSIVLFRSIRADAANVAPAYILFGHEESRNNRSGFRSRM